MLKQAKRLGLAALVLTLGGVGAFGAVTVMDGASKRQALKSNNLTSLRQEALKLFPRGSQLASATTYLGGIGFACEAIQHPLPDISSPSLRCASDGRGYPEFPAVNVILLTRNGLVSDVDVWNIMARADQEPDDIDFTATGASDALPARLRRPSDGDDRKPERAAPDS